MKRPYFKKSHNAWYINQGKGKPPLRLGKTEDEAMAEWAKLAAPAAEQAPAPPAAGLTLADLVKEWVGWVGKHKSKETLRSYRHYANNWAELHGTVPAASIRGFHVTKLCDEKFPSTGGYSDSVRWQAQKVAKVMFGWAKSEGLIDANPLAEWKKSTRCGKRQTYLKVADYEKLLAACTDPDFRDLIECLWECGARPHELFQAEARHLHSEGKHGQLVFHKLAGDTVKSKDDDATRAITLSSRAYEIVSRLAAKYPSGPLFRRELSGRWNVQVCSRRFATLERKTGIKATLYDFRHGFAHHHVTVKKTDIITLATLMGHRDTQMLAKVYSHADANKQHLFAAVG